MANGFGGLGSVGKGFADALNSYARYQLELRIREDEEKRSFDRQVSLMQQQQTFQEAAERRREATRAREREAAAQDPIARAAQLRQLGLPIPPHLQREIETRFGGQLIFPRTLGPASPDLAPAPGQGVASTALSEELRPFGGPQQAPTLGEVYGNAIRPELRHTRVRVDAHGQIVPPPPHFFVAQEKTPAQQSAEERIKAKVAASGVESLTPGERQLWERLPGTREPSKRTIVDPTTGNRTTVDVAANETVTFGPVEGRTKPVYRRMRDGRMVKLGDVPANAVVTDEPRPVNVSVNLPSTETPLAPPGGQQRYVPVNIRNPKTKKTETQWKDTQTGTFLTTSDMEQRARAGGDPAAAAALGVAGTGMEFGTKDLATQRQRVHAAYQSLQSAPDDKTRARAEQRWQFEAGKLAVMESQRGRGQATTEEQRTPAQTVTEGLPPPNQYPAGTMATSKKTGKKYRSDGKRWVPIP